MAITGVVVMGLLGLAAHRLHRRAERKSDTKEALSLLGDIAVLVALAGPGDLEELARLVARLGQAEDDAPESVQPSLTRVGGRLESYRSGWVVASVGGSGVPVLAPSAADVLKAIDRARADIQRYRRVG
ncbi:hypothetical protein J7E91_32765 [Streptomyces sp. ISL-99]|uniref:hypothetical protein n=1 Tax=Streptomyces sp. ISL-99 TaxID=2819193 RepID=UPI001BE96DB7|nr:hypothetical protein [Streptomyces sp. ISL-99]MBT2530003.1 hypothetical protein [Streptomyces sp. ISL-99]